MPAQPEEECQTTRFVVYDMKHIDTNLIDAYTHGIARVCQQANERIAELEQENAKLKEDIKKMMRCDHSWHPATECPPDGTRCIVRTDTGATYFCEPINGKWMKNIVKWMYTPE